MNQTIIKNTLKAIAILESIISPEWEYRYFSYNSKWSDAEEMASMRDGAGEGWFLWIKDTIMAWKYFNHELGVEKDSASIIKQFPVEFNSFIHEPAFSIKESTCLWYFKEQKWCKFGIDNKLIEEVTQTFTWVPEDYKKWADTYYEKDLDIDAISSVFKHQMNEQIIKKLNPDLSLEMLQNDIKEIGFQYES